MMFKKLRNWWLKRQVKRKAKCVDEFVLNYLEHMDSDALNEYKETYDKISDEIFKIMEIPKDRFNI